MAESDDFNDPEPDIELESILNLYDGKPEAPIHAKLVLKSRKAFAAGVITVKGFYMAERGVRILSHQQILDATLEAVPVGRCQIHLLTEKFTEPYETSDTWDSLPHTNSFYFVFYKNGYEILRHKCILEYDLEHPLRRSLGEGTTNYIVDFE